MVLILHIATGSNYNVIRPFIRFVNEEFDNGLHEFIIMDKKTSVPDDILVYPNVVVVDTRYKSRLSFLITRMYKSDKIVLHSLNKTSFQFLLLMNPTLQKRVFWVSWGADLYQWKTREFGLKYKIRNQIAYRIRMRLPNFVGIFPPDIDFFKEEFKTSAKTFYASYVGGLYNPLYREDLKLVTLEEKLATGETINIQIGHQCNPILNHVKILEALHRFRHENIRVHIPLSYGDREYGDMVEDRALSLFGDKAYCIREMMPKDEYLDFLSTIDIAIFNTPRQIGLGNITPLMFMGKKLIIPKGTVMYDLGIPIVDYNRVKSMDFNEFAHPVDMSKGKEYVLQNGLNKKKKVEMWRNVFNASLGEEDKG